MALLQIIASNINWSMIINIFFSLFGFASAAMLYTFLIVVIPYFAKKIKGQRAVSYKKPSKIKAVDFIAPFALDIGGTRTKVVYLDFETKEDKIRILNESRKINPKEYINSKRTPTFIEFSPVSSFDFRSIDLESFEIPIGIQGAVMRFLEYPSSDQEAFFEYLKSHKLLERFGKKAKSCNATGGGAYKYSDLVQSELGINFIQRDEIGSLIKGLDFLLSLKGIESPIFSFEDKEKKGVFFNNKRELYPYIFVQCGSGISIILVKDKGKFERVSGSTIGGGTFNGLVRLLTGTTDFKQAIKLAKNGDNCKVDLLVGDIYGKDYGEHGLSAQTIASTFGKVGTMKIPENKKLSDAFEPGDAVKSLLFMIANNISQISILNAKKYKAKNVFYSGGFIRNNEHVWSKLVWGMKYWTKGEIKAMFVNHDSYLGALGAFIQK